MKVTVFGANGKVGSQIVGLLLERGHTVRAFVHHGNLPANPNLEIFEGDIYDKSSVERALVGSEAVISALGSWHTPKKDILTSGMQSIIPAMQAAGIKRVISLTGDAAKAPGDHFSLYLAMAHPMIRLIAPKVLQDGETHIALLAASQLDWTVLRSPVMTASSKGDYQLAAKPHSPIISRRAVALAMVDQLERDDWLQAAPFLRKD